MFELEFNKGGMNGPNYIIKRRGKFVGYLYLEADEPEDAEAIQELLTRKI
jgi:hypothetical protein